ncbi:MAG: hypothetical protein ABEJ07_02830 [Candidatus Nanohaloarchaea archaeon]
MHIDETGRRSLLENIRVIAEYEGANYERDEPLYQNREEWREIYGLSREISKQTDAESINPLYDIENAGKRFEDFCEELESSLGRQWSVSTLELAMLSSLYTCIAEENDMDFSQLRTENDPLVNLDGGAGWESRVEYVLDLTESVSESLEPRTSQASSAGPSSP